MTLQDLLKLISVTLTLIFISAFPLLAEENDYCKIFDLSVPQEYRSFCYDEIVLEEKIYDALCHEDRTFDKDAQGKLIRRSVPRDNQKMIILSSAHIQLRKGLGVKKANEQRVGWILNSYEKRAQAYTALNSIDLAINDYTAELILYKELYPDSNAGISDIYGSRALLFFSLGKYSNAISDYTAAIENYMAWEVVGTDFFGVSPEEFRRNKTDHLGKLHTYRGFSHYVNNDYKNAIADFRQAIENYKSIKNKFTGRWTFAEELASSWQGLLIASSELSDAEYRKALNEFAKEDIKGFDSFDDGTTYVNKTNLLVKNYIMNDSKLSRQEIFNIASQESGLNECRLILTFVLEALRKGDFRLAKQLLKINITETNKCQSNVDNYLLSSGFAKSIKVRSNEIAENLPSSLNDNANAVAVVIGSKEYQKTKRVDYAVNDAKLIKKYLINVMGYKEGNIFYIENASKSDFELLFGNQEEHKGRLYNAIKADKSDVFIYYSGHGAPGLKSKRGYFVPVEADPQYLEISGYPLDLFYANIAKLNTKSITVVLDACFSGATVYDNISPIVIEVQNPVINMKNGIVLASSTGSQVSAWFNEKEQGIFTYLFLKAIHNKNADYNHDNKLTYDEIYRYISDKTNGVPYYARKLHNVDQNPTIQGTYSSRVFVTYK